MGNYQFFFCIAYFLFGSYLMAVAGDITDQIYFQYYCTKQEYRSTPLPDLFDWLSLPIFHYFHKHNIRSLQIIDFLIGIFSLIFSVQLFTNKNLQGKRLLIISRLLMVWGTCCYLRAICLTTTVLPSFEHDICASLSMHRAIWESKSVLLSGLLHLAAPITRFYPQADYMFSGHATAATSLALFCLYEVMDESRCYWIKTISIFILYTVTVVLIFLARVHYTADVVIGMFISALSYLSYHLMVERSKRKEATFPINVVRWIEKQHLHLE